MQQHVRNFAFADSLLDDSVHIPYCFSPSLSQQQFLNATQRRKMFAGCVSTSSASRRSAACAGDL